MPLVLPTIPPPTLARIEDVLDTTRHLISTYLERLRCLKEPIPSQTKTRTLADGQRYASPVTPLDCAVQRMLIGGLTSLLGPDLAVFAEEDGYDDPAALGQELCAVIDPIDQTRMLLRGGLTYTINLALVHDGQITGWMDAPGLGIRLHASPDGFSSNGVPVPTVPLRPDRVTVAVTPHELPALPASLGDQTVYPLVASGVSWRLGLVATGQADAMLVLPRGAAGPALWDWLPLVGGLTRRGCQVLDLTTGADLADLRPPEVTGGLVAGPPEVCELLRAATTQQGAPDHTNPKRQVTGEPAG